MSWRYLLFPELEQVPESQRDRVWRRANAESFQPGEWVMILIAVAAAALVVRSAGFKSFLGSGFLSFAADFICAGAVLLIIAGPVYWRRVKRGLAAAIRSKEK